jgi:hypothetical protein
MMRFQGGEVIDLTTFRLETGRTPKAIDLHVHEEKAARGIYSIDGEFLKICTAAPGSNSKRPAEFNEPGCQYVELKRVSNIGSEEMLALRQKVKAWKDRNEENRKKLEEESRNLAKALLGKWERDWFPSEKIRAGKGRDFNEFLEFKSDGSVTKETREGFDRSSTKGKFTLKMDILEIDWTSAENLGHKDRWIVFYHRAPPEETMSWFRLPKAEEFDPKWRRQSEKNFSILEIELVGGDRYKGDNRFFLLHRKEPAVTLQGVEKFFQENKNLEVHIIIRTAPEMSVSENSPVVRGLKNLTDKYKFPNRIDRVP